MFWTQHLATAVTAKGRPPVRAGWDRSRRHRCRAAAAGGRGRGAGAAPGRRVHPGPVMPGGRDAGDNVFAISSGGMVHLMNPQVGTDQTRRSSSCRRTQKSWARFSSATCCMRRHRQMRRRGRTASGQSISSATGQDRRPRSTRRGRGLPAPWRRRSAPTEPSTSPPAAATRRSPMRSSRSNRKRSSRGTGSPHATPFTSAPVVFQYKGKDLIVAANKDGRLYLFDSASMGGADHRPPLSRTAAVTSAAPDVAGLGTWIDAAGTRWVVATIGGPVAAGRRSSR